MLTGYVGGHCFKTNVCRTYSTLVLFSLRAQLRRTIAVDQGHPVNMTAATPEVRTIGLGQGAYCQPQERNKYALRRDKKVEVS